MSTFRCRIKYTEKIKPLVIYYNMITPFLAIIETPPCVWTLTNVADGAVLFTCSVSSSASATSLISYLDAVCIASKIAYNENKNKAIQLLGQYRINRQTYNLKNKIGQHKLKETSCYCNTYTYDYNGYNYTYQDCVLSNGSSCVGCSPGNTTCCEDIIYMINETSGNTYCGTYGLHTCGTSCS